MAKLPPIKLISREDIGSDAPDWLEKLLYPLNLFMTSIYESFNKNLTEVNFKSQVKQFTIIGSSTPTDNTYSFTTDYQTTPDAVILNKVERTDNQSVVFTTAPFVSWNYRNGLFNVLAINGLSNGVSYKISLKLSYS
jgi:hypothetical protein